MQRLSDEEKNQVPGKSCSFLSAHVARYMCILLREVCFCNPVDLVQTHFGPLA